MASDGAKTADVSLTSDVADHSLDHPAKTSKAAEELAEGIDGDDGQEEDDEMDGHGDAVHVDGQSNNGAATRKKKKSKKRKPKAGTTDMSSAQALSEASPASTKQMPVQDIQSLLHQLSMSQSDAGKKDGKPAEDYKFWNTQPVPKFSEPNLLQTTNPTADGESLPEGPILPDKICRASAKPEPGKLVDGFEWCLVDLDDPQEITELYDLLDNHYVEDTDGSFRFKYSIEFLSWALKPPGWKKDWHIGVRTKSVDTQKKGKLVAFIAGIPVTIKVGPATLQASEINFLAIHRKLRGKRLAPELIKEITRRCYRNDIFQALYTAGTLLPTPITTCRYYHRSLDWEQLYKVGFSHLPRGSSEYKQKLRYKLEPQTSLPGLRAMQRKDVPAVRTLLISYLERFHLRQEWSPEEIEHWFCSAASKDVVWSYVVEDPTTGQVTDFMSYYLLEVKPFPISPLTRNSNLTLPSSPPSSAPTLPAKKPSAPHTSTTTPRSLLPTP